LGTAPRRAERRKELVGIFIRLVLNALALWLTAGLLRGIHVDGAGPLIVAALVLGVLNAFVRPILFFLTLPINVLTLGLFTLVLNGLMLKLTAALVDGFRVDGFWWAVLGALVMSVFSLLLSLFVADTGRIEVVYIERR
jgi:putative membrane protein